MDTVRRKNCSFTPMRMSMPGNERYACTEAAGCQRQ